MTMANGWRPFDDVRAALGDADGEPVDPSEASGRPSAPTPSVRFDPHRFARTGVPEVVHAEHKSAADVAIALARQADLVGRALASRCAPDVAAEVRRRLAETYEVTVHDLARAVVVARPEAPVEATGGRVGVICAGTSDVPIAAEAALMAREMGATVEEVRDVGVAGLHRLVRPLERLVAAGVDAMIVAAGMDGALPSVVAGLVAVPVIGLPTSVGYGFGGGGIGALTTMLQSCSPGLVVVNVDNGIGAGATAALIANRVAAARAGGAVALTPPPPISRARERGEHAP